jgi:hypothetical protein
MRLEILIIVMAVLLLVFVIEVVRRRRLSESYALLWIAVGIGGLLLGVGRRAIDAFSDTLGVSYGANLVFAFVFLFLLVIAVNLSMHVSRLEDQVTSLAEEIALLRGPRRPLQRTEDDDDSADVPTSPGG